LRLSRTRRRRGAERGGREHRTRKRGASEPALLRANGHDYLLSVGPNTCLDNVLYGNGIPGNNAPA
jgi:hypothetical protein